MMICALNRPPCTTVRELGITYAFSSFTRKSLMSILDTKEWRTSPSAYRTSLCSLDNRVTAAATGMFSNIYSCQFLPSVPAFFGTSVLRLSAMIFFCASSVSISTIRSRKLLMDR